MCIYDILFVISEIIIQDESILGDVLPSSSRPLTELSEQVYAVSGHSDVPLLVK